MPLLAWLSGVIFAAAALFMPHLFSDEYNRQAPSPTPSLSVLGPGQTL